MVYIIGDIHGNFKELKGLCERLELSKEDTIILLGDHGINYYLNYRDIETKNYIRKHIKPTLFCIRGNHDANPQKVLTCNEKMFFGNKVLFEEGYENILYALNGYDYDINGIRSFVIGGAASVDKELRLLRGWSWFEDEVPTKEELDEIENYYDFLSSNPETSIENILCHTCPFDAVPIDMFIGSVDQSKVDNTMEHFLQKISDKKKHKKIYCGHYHTDRKIGEDVEMLFASLQEYRKETRLPWDLM